MTWARLDDGFHSHPKVLRAWDLCPASIGLFARALSYVAQQEIDGVVPEQLVRMWIPEPGDREEVVEALVDAGLWDKNGAGTFVIHDYLDFNYSREQLTDNRRRDRERKRESRRRPG